MHPLLPTSGPLHPTSKNSRFYYQFFGSTSNYAPISTNFLPFTSNFEEATNLLPTFRKYVQLCTSYYQLRDLYTQLRRIREFTTNFSIVHPTMHALLPTSGPLPPTLSLVPSIPKTSHSSSTKKGSVHRTGRCCIYHIF